MTDLERELVRFTIAYGDEVTSALGIRIEDLDDRAEGVKGTIYEARLRVAQEKARHALDAFGVLAGKAGEL